MKKLHRYGLYYSLATAAAAATAVGGEALAANTCTCLPSTRIFTTGSSVFKYLGSPTAGYEAELISDNLYGYVVSASDVSLPKAWIDWQPTTTLSTTVWTYACRLSASGVQITCGSSNTRTTTSLTPQEMEAPSTGLYGSTNSRWDRYVLRVQSSSAINPTTVPQELPKAL